MKCSNLTLRFLISSVSSQWRISAMQAGRYSLAVLETRLGEDTLEALPDHEASSITSEARVCEIRMSYKDR
jgi:hypothetical protein